MRRLNKITTQTCRVYKFYSTSVQSVTSALSYLNCQTKRILIGGFAILLSVIAQGLDVRLAGMVSEAIVKMCRCFHTCRMTRFNNYASDWSLHVTLAVNKMLEISRVGRPSVVNKQKKWVFNTKAGLYFQGSYRLNETKFPDISLIFPWRQSKFPWHNPSF